MQRIKSEKIAILLAALPGAIGFLGIGHLYIGRIRRGLILLMGAWGLAGTGILCFVIWSMSSMVIPPPGYPKVEVPTYYLAFFAVGFVSFLGLVGLWIWQIFDARTMCQNHNRQVSEWLPSPNEVSTA